MNNQSLSVLDRLEADIAKVEPTRENIGILVANMCKAMGWNLPQSKVAVKKVLAQVNDPQLALAGIRELGQAVLDSGIPQAALVFAVTYKLIDGLAKAPEQAREELQVQPY